MVFSSIIFICIFLPIMIIGYYVLPKKCRNIYLLLGSLFFYAWGEPKYIFLMLASIVGNYAFGMLIHHLAVKRVVVAAIIIGTRQNNHGDQRKYKKKDISHKLHRTNVEKKQSSKQDEPPNRALYPKIPTTR